MNRGKSFEHVECTLVHVVYHVRVVNDYRCYPLCATETEADVDRLGEVQTQKERLLNETFNYFLNDKDTSEMIEFIKPYTERAGLRNAMKILNQKYGILKPAIRCKRM